MQHKNRISEFWDTGKPVMPGESGNLLCGDNPALLRRRRRTPKDWQKDVTKLVGSYSLELRMKAIERKIKLLEANLATLRGQQAVTHKGTAKGRIIELDESLPYQNGQQVSVCVEPLTEKTGRGSPAIILQVMDAPPHLSSEAVNEMLQAIEDSKLLVESKGIFDEK